MEMYLIRHGQSEANKQKIIQGHGDFPLSSIGKKQAVLLGDALKHHNFDAIYSSDLQRAFYTAEAIGEHHYIQVQKLNFLREVGLGPLEGLNKQELSKQYPELGNKSILTTGIPGTETIASITARCRRTIDFFQANHERGTVAVVSHGGFISILLTYLMVGDSWYTVDRPFVMSNTGITKLKTDRFGKWKVHFVNSTAHLDGAGLEEGRMLP
ncbi:MAG: histidine phosphatase family protein [Bacillus sp. (in: Bacteria)]|nr:histidine phosphatase family protein [Bacillus sp. (in: firmicutes)]